MHICLIYDCLFPWTIGGAERWYRNLAERLAQEGHQVTYLTLRQWDEAPRIGGVEVIAVGPRMPLYSEGKRRILPPLRFGWGVLTHLLRHGGRYDIVHTASFPYFSLLAAGFARRFGGYRIVCDWFEVWSDEYWREYLGPLGQVGSFIQRLCARIPQRAYAFSRLHAARLQALGMKQVSVMTGMYSPPPERETHPLHSMPPTIVYAGRFIPEKRIHLLVEAIAYARKSIPGLRATLIGDGPTRDDVIERIEALGLSDIVEVPGFVAGDVVERSMAEALCVVQPSSREGYGMVVIEAAHRGVPIVVVAAPDNAATELVDDGRNGFIVADERPDLLAAAIVETWLSGAGLRASARDWYEENEQRLSLENSLQAVVRHYEDRSLSEPCLPGNRGEERAASLS